MFTVCDNLIDRLQLPDADRVMQARGAARVLVRHSPQTVVAVFGKTGKDAVHAAALVWCVLKRRVPARCPLYVSPWAIMDEDLLSELLMKHYAGPRGSHQVAEAARSLRRMKRRMDLRLLKVLYRRPELVELAAAVRKELEG